MVTKGGSLPERKESKLLMDSKDGRRYTKRVTKTTPANTGRFLKRFQSYNTSSQSKRTNRRREMRMRTTKA